MNSNDFDSWNREAILNAALEYRSAGERYRSELVYTETQLARATAERDRLREALEFAEQRSKQISETSNDYYERLAEEFRTTYGHLPPGKDDPLRTVDPDILQQEWEEFLSEPANARRTALQEAEG